MSRSLRQRDRNLFLAGILAGFSIACSKQEANRTPSTESAASTTARDTASAAPNTAAPPSPPAPSATPPAAASPSRPLPRPSVDPGRILPKAARDSVAAAVKPSTDTTAAAAAPAPSSPSAAQGQTVKYDPASNTVTFGLMAGPFNFNGYTNGGATLTLPPKANVVINFVNKDGTPHSAEVISGEGPIPNAAVDPAIPRAYTNKLLEGLPQEASDDIRFTAPDSGTYRIFCGVPGHGLSGMWIWMKIDPAAKAPSFGPTK
ncbi:MAG: sulfocyanin-like copper-binding protein [Gemmatimonadales bacterium]